MKTTQYILVFVIIVLLYLCWDTNNDNNRLKQNETLLTDSITNYLVIDSLYKTQSQANLRIMQVINDSEQRKLQNDSIYMELLTKIN